MPQWYDATVIKIQDETPFVKRYYLAVDGISTFDFLPGQFITFDLPISDKRQARWRSYSISNAPDGSNVVELCIVRKYDGIATTFLFDDINIGDKLKFKGPSGTFTLPSAIVEKRLVMICTGTGIAPFRSFIQYVDRMDLPFKEMHMIFGARYQSDILYRSEMEALTHKYNNFHYDIALSKDMEWHGHKGYVHDIYISKYNGNTDNTLFYLCGWTAMVDEAVANLIVKLGCDKQQVIYELYG